MTEPRKATILGIPEDRREAFFSDVSQAEARDTSKPLSSHGDITSLYDVVLPLSLPVVLGLAAWLVKERKRSKFSIHIIERHEGGYEREVSITSHEVSEKEISDKIIRAFELTSDKVDDTK